MLVLVLAWQGVSLHLVRKFARHLLRALAFLSLPQVGMYAGLWYSMPIERVLENVYLSFLCLESCTLYTYDVKNLTGVDTDVVCACVPAAGAFSLTGR